MDEREHGRRVGGAQPAVPEPVRRRLDEVFGEVLPDVTRDEQPDVEDQPAAVGDEWLQANRPPHHGG